MSTGKSPTQARALDLLRRGASLVSVQDLLGVPSVTVKRWAKKAGIEVRRPTAAEMETIHERRRAASKHLRDTTLSITAEPTTERRIVGDRTTVGTGPNIKPGGR